MDNDTLSTTLDAEVVTLRCDLAYRCEGLATSLSQLTMKLRGDRAHDKLCINSLGEIQMQGTIIDAECGRLAALINVLRMINEKTE